MDRNVKAVLLAVVVLLQLGALAWMIPGHEAYHRTLIRRDYLGQGG